MKNRFHYSNIIFLLFFCALYFNCAQKKQANSNKKSEVKIATKTTTPDSIELLLERGAFEYDNFSLKDTILTYTPSEHTNFGKDSLNTLTHVLQITKNQKDSLLNYIKEKKIFDFKERYTNQTTCNSGLWVTLTLNGKMKKISCADFRRGCPDEIQYLEKLMIRWLGEFLNRKILPG